MSIDKNKILFNAAVIDVVFSHFNASCGEKESEPFLNRLYDEYKNSGSPKSVKSWLKKRLEGEFKFLDKPPEWVGDEPNWPYHNGEPMVFIMQKKILKKAESFLGWGYVIYVFGKKLEEDDGWEIVTKVVTQDYVM